MKSIKIKNSKMFLISIFILLFISIIASVFLITWLLGKIIDLLDIYIVFLIMSFVFLVPIALVGPQYRKAIISEKGIEFYIKKDLVFSSNWSELEKISFKKALIYYPSERFSRHLRQEAHMNLEYVIHFIGSNVDKTIRLWYFPFKVKSQELIVHAIKRFTGTMKNLKTIELSEDTKIDYCDGNYKKMHTLLYDGKITDKRLFQHYLLYAYIFLFGSINFIFLGIFIAKNFLKIIWILLGIILIIPTIYLIILNLIKPTKRREKLLENWKKEQVDKNSLISHMLQNINQRENLSKKKWNHKAKRKTIKKMEKKKKKLNRYLKRNK
ncbi:MAG: hypothetical protein ACFFAH_17855 [Promethearchaeota archaeon]